MTKTQYIQKMYAILVPMCAKWGFHNVAAGMIAQSIQEGWNSKLATEYHNYWGMKAGKDYKGKTKAMNNKAGNDPAVYRIFSSMEEGCEGYFIFLSYSRYQPLKSCTTDSEFLDKIGPCGWNANKGYGDRCKSHLKEVYEAIAKADTGTSESQTLPLPTQLQYNAGTTYTTQQDLYVRDAPDGKKIKFDKLTANAKEHAKKDLLGYAILKKGTKVTCKGIRMTQTCTWPHIPSGWICARNSKNIYVL